MPVQLGRNGREKIIEVGLSEEEAGALQVSAGKVREAIEKLSQRSAAGECVPGDAQRKEDFDAAALNQLVR